MIKKQIELYAKYAGIAAICLEWFAVLFFYAQRPADFSGDYTISSFATLPQTRLVFSICLTAAAISFWIFTRYHLHKHYNTPVKLFAVSMLGYAAMALVPFDPTNSLSGIAHRVLALLFSFTFLAGIYFMAKNNTDTYLRRVSYAASILSGIVLLVFLNTPKDSQFILVLEALSGFICQIWVVWISFYSFRAGSSKSS